MTGESMAEKRPERQLVSCKNQDRPPKSNDYTYEKWKKLIEL